MLAAIYNVLCSSTDFGCYLQCFLLLEACILACYIHMFFAKEFHFGCYLQCF